MKRKIILISTLLLLSVALVTTAQDSSREQRRARILKMFDKDGDGRLSEEERARLREVVVERRNKATEASEPATVEGLYGQAAPRLPIQSRDLELTDTSRARTIPVRVTEPQQSGRFPVIVWSHGMYGSQDFYRPLVDHWAGQGYVVVQPSHEDSILRGTLESSNATSAWSSRPQDISHIIDSLSTLTTKGESKKIGMGGHSFGAHTTMLIGGATPRVGNTFQDSRPKAFIAISPQGNSRLLNDSSWSGIKRPTLFISGDNDTSRNGESAQWRRTPFDQATPGEKYLLWVKGAHHNFGGISGARHAKSGPMNADQVELVKAATLAFWDMYLKNNPQATEVIDAGAFPKEMGSWTER